MKADFTPYLPPRPKAKVATLWIILGSLLLHLMMLILVARSPNEITKFETTEGTPAKIKPITARLIYTPVSTIVTPSPEPTTTEKPEPSITVEPAPTAEPVIESDPVPVIPSQPEPIAPEPALEAPSKQAPEPTIETLPAVPQPEIKSDANFIQQDPLASPADTERPKMADDQAHTVADKVKNQLHSSSQRSIAELAAEEAARYRREQTSPSLLDKPELSKLTEDEKLQKENEVLADCSSYTNKGIAILAGLTGGNIKCTTTNGAESFIQDRLNKTAHLPAMKDNKGN
tara:strand:+ start:497 stop:1360 length:864 start_codon:yes stop_codon:yes gene_type:complete